MSFYGCVKVRLLPTGSMRQVLICGSTQAPDIPVPAGTQGLQPSPTLMCTVDRQVLLVSVYLCSVLASRSICCRSAASTLLGSRDMASASALKWSCEAREE